MLSSKKKHLHLASGDIVNRKYQVIDEVGCGNFAKVYRCQVLKIENVLSSSGMASSLNQVTACIPVSSKSKSITSQHSDNDNLSLENTIVAMKVIRKEDRESAMFERRMLRILSERNRNGKARVSRMYEYFEWKNCPVFIMPLHGLSLRSFWLGISRVSVSRLMVLEFAYDMLETLSFIHFDCRMVHTDLKPENILLEDARTPNSSSKHKWVICDFGSSSLWRRDRLDSDLISTRPYRAPEVILGNKWHYAADMWSLGCIIYEVAVGHRLFEVSDDNTHLQVMEKRLGKLPDMFVRRSRNSSKYFTPKGGFAHLSESLLSSKRQIHSIKTMFQKDVTFLELLSALLTYDPAKRITAPYALWLPVFDPIRHRKPQPPIPVAVEQNGGVRASTEGGGPAFSAKETVEVEKEKEKEKEKKKVCHAPRSALLAAPSPSGNEEVCLSDKRRGTVELQLPSAISSPCDGTLLRLNTSTIHSVGLTSSWKSDTELCRRCSSGTAQSLSGESLNISKMSPSFSKSANLLAELPSVKSKANCDVKRKSEMNEGSRPNLDICPTKATPHCSKDEPHELSSSKTKGSGSAQQRHSLSNSYTVSSSERQQSSEGLYNSDLRSKTLLKENSNIVSNAEAKSPVGRFQDASDKNATSKKQETLNSLPLCQLDSESKGMLPPPRFLKEDRFQQTLCSEKNAPNVRRSSSRPPSGKSITPSPVSHPADSALSTVEVERAVLRKPQEHATPYNSTASSSLATYREGAPARAVHRSSSDVDATSPPQEGENGKSREVQGPAVAAASAGASLPSPALTNGRASSSTTPVLRGQGDGNPPSKDAIGRTPGPKSAAPAKAPSMAALNECNAALKVEKGPVGSSVTLVLRKRSTPPSMGLPQRGAVVVAKPTSALPLFVGSPVAVPSVAQLFGGRPTEPTPAGPPPKAATHEEKEIEKENGNGKGKEGASSAGTRLEGSLSGPHKAAGSPREGLSMTGSLASLTSAGQSLEGSTRWLARTHPNLPAAWWATNVSRGRGPSRHRHSGSIPETREVDARGKPRTLSLCMMPPTLFRSELTRSLVNVPAPHPTPSLKPELSITMTSPSSSQYEAGSLRYGGSAAANAIVQEQAGPPDCSKSSPRRGQDCLEEKISGEGLNKGGGTEEDSNGPATRRTSCAPSSLLIQRHSPALRGGTTFVRALPKAADFKNFETPSSIHPVRQHFLRKNNASDYQHAIYANKKIRNNSTNIVVAINNGTR